MSLFSLTDLQIAEHDWSRSRLGQPPEWPPALRSLLAMMLACPSPMFLGWGPDLLCFYNDAYRSVLGHRAENVLGRPFNHIVSEAFYDVEPMIRRALSGEVCTADKLPLDIREGDTSGERWTTFSYSPVFDDIGAIRGFLANSRETQAQVLAAPELTEPEGRSDMCPSVGDNIGTWDWDVSTDRVTTNSRFALLYGLEPNRATDGAPFAEFLKQVHPDDRTRLDREVAAAIDKCGSFSSKYRLLQAGGGIRWVSAQGRCVADGAGQPVRFLGVTHDITDHVNAKTDLEAAETGKLLPHDGT